MAHFERSNLTKLAEAMAKRIDRMAAGDCQKVGAIGSVGLVGAVDRGSPVRGAGDHCRRKYPANIPIGDEILRVIEWQSRPGDAYRPPHSP